MIQNLRFSHYLNIYTSENGIDFTLLKTLSDDLPLSEMGATYESELMVPMSGSFRYLRIESTHSKESILNAIAIAELIALLEIMLSVSLISFNSVISICF